jgi:hypothetical protein
VNCLHEVSQRLETIATKGSVSIAFTPMSVDEGVNMAWKYTKEAITRKKQNQTIVVTLSKEIHITEKHHIKLPKSDGNPKVAYSPETRFKLLEAD